MFMLPMPVQYHDTRNVLFFCCLVDILLDRAACVEICWIVLEFGFEHKLGANLRTTFALCCFVGSFGEGLRSVCLWFLVHGRAPFGWVNALRERQISSRTR